MFYFTYTFYIGNLKILNKIKKMTRKYMQFCDLQIATKMLKTNVLNILNDFFSETKHRIAMKTYIIFGPSQTDSVLVAFEWC